ncbi:hypothetical protein [Pseudoalteromonas byunsanensis]|uniref:Uncharacterized protein n=1 Tax=Pseudoalteromonas byunsanensis TaxID=327939 RepID=A0A1S1N5F4_9GAMM|nr:hypothetical protein [Pseudoalteromonas byunsanensis]OHU93493.1 hypothetical protein BIW53_19255 [Pseudoalteromonas byunsanensis]
MKTKIALSLLAIASTITFAQVESTEQLVQNIEQDGVVTFDKAVVEVSKVDGVFATSATTYYSPRVWVRGYLESFFVNPTNGNQFCEERGHNQEVTGSTIKCGEDESSYANYDWYGKAWTKKSTGSKNQCYQLYSTIKCQ